MTSITATRVAGPATLTSHQTTVFSALWALAHIAHLLRKGDVTQPWMWLVLIAAMLVLERPSSWRRMSVLAATQLPYLYVNLPATDNHLIIMGFANLGILVAVLRTRSVVDGRSDDAPPLPALSDAFPFLRISIILAYGAAAIAKLNAGFFDLEVSCAVTLTEDALEILGERAPDLPDTVVAILPYTVAAFELAIPVLLLFRSTRVVGVATVVLFHLAMSFSPTATAGDFTVVLFALVFLFLPVEAAAWIHGIWSRVRRRMADRFPFPRGVWLIVGTGLVAAMIGGEGLEFFTVADNRNWVWVASLGLGLGGLLLAACWVSVRSRWSQQARLWPTSWLYAPIVALLLLTAAAPYIGSKTLSVFTMYSNLQTEMQESNHYLIPRLPRDGSQDDLVSIEASSNRRLQRLGDRGRMISFHELRRELAGDPEASIRYVRGGVIHDLAEAAEDPELVTTDWPAHRFVQHRLYDPDRPWCRW